MRIAICDDDKIYRNNTKKIRYDYLCERKKTCELVEFSSGEQLFSYKGEIHILLLDIEMEGMDGIAVKERLGEQKRDIIIIYISSHSELMQEAFGRQVFSFLTKPIGKDKFFQLMDKVMREFDEDITVEIDNKDNPYIKGSSILYIKSEDKYTRVKTLSKEYLVRRSMNEWEKILEGHDFYRTHKSYMVNLAFVKRLGKVILMDNGAEISISRKNVQLFKEKYFDYIKRKAK